MTETQVLVLTDEDVAALKEIATNFRTGKVVWKWLIRLGGVSAAIAGFAASCALVWQAWHGQGVR